MNKFLFLDLDGVLNTVSTRNARGINGTPTLDTTPILLLLRLHLVSNCDFVISSAWRNFFGYEEVIHEYLHQAGWADVVPIPIIGKTPRLQTGRGEEVDAWLRQNAPDAVPWSDYVILDDIDRDFGYDQPLVKTNELCGLSYDDLLKIASVWKIPVEQLNKFTFNTKTTTEICVPTFSDLP